LEHTEQLGLTFAAIAGEKAGIIKTEVPVISGVMNEEAQKVILKIAKEKSAPLYRLGEAFDIISPDKNDTFTFRTIDTAVNDITANDTAVKSTDIKNLCSAMYGIHQQRNAALAIEGLHLLRRNEVFCISDEDIRKGIAGAMLPVRIEIIEQQDKPVLIFDGAHTKDSVNALLETVMTKYPEKSITAIFGISSGKDIDGIFDELLPRVDKIIFTQHSSGVRRVSPQELYEFVRQNRERSLAKCSVISDCLTALDAAVKNAAGNGLICITGSLFLAAELSKLIQK